MITDIVRTRLESELAPERLDIEIEGNRLSIVIVSACFEAKRLSQSCFYLAGSCKWRVFSTLLAGSVILYQIWDKI